MCIHTHITMSVSHNYYKKIMAIKINWLSVEFVWNNEMSSAGGCPTLCIH